MPSNPPIQTLGSYTNPTGSTISGSSYGVELLGAGAVLNEGSISASAGTAVIVDGVGFVTNTSSGVLTGSANGIFTDGAGNIYNSGLVSGLQNAGVFVNGVGIIDNFASAEILGSSFGLKIAGAGTVENLGSIYGLQGTGIYVDGVGIVTNSGTGAISGSSFGLDILAAGTVANYGSISGSQGTGVFLGGVGTLTNHGMAVISGSSFGVDINAGGIVSNDGTISASQGDGVVISGVGNVVNHATAVISGSSFGVYIGAAGSVLNAGSISASQGSGVNIHGAGDVINLAGGTIDGSTYGVNMQGVATVDNAGVIDGSLGTIGGAVVFQGASGDLIVDPGAVFNGNVSDLGGSGLIELTAGTMGSIGTLDMGTSFSGFTTIDFDPGSSWLLEGGTAAVADGQLINGFSIGDTIVLEGFAETSDTYVSGEGLELSNGSTIQTVGITGDYDTNSFLVTTLANGDTEIIICYLRGTRILTPTGEVNVETLKIGDNLVTRWQGVQPIKWIGRQSFDARFVKDNRERIPVRIAADALGKNLPLRDLYVSPAHSMLVDNTLVLAKSLVNGITITQDEMPDEVHYYLIEFETHDCVLAEGTWSESFADCSGLRDKFHNAADFYELYPEYRTPDELALCAPRPERGIKLDTVLRPIAARALAITTQGELHGWIDNIGGPWKIHGWAQDIQNPELPVLLEVLLSDRVIGTILACDYRGDLAEAGIGVGRCSFTFNSPVNLTSAVKDKIKVRRVGDRSEIFMTPSCLDHPTSNAPIALRMIA